MDHAETRKHKKNLIYKQNNPQLYQRMMQNIREVDACVILDKTMPWNEDAVKVTCYLDYVNLHHNLRSCTY